VKARQGALLAVCVLVGMLAGYQLGRPQSAAVTWHTGLAEIGDREVSIITPGWTYGAQDSVPGWIDSSGANHDGGWPDCVNPSGTQKQLRFAATNVTTAGTTWRQIVVVDCRRS
jgi:hypothetical protein